MQIIINEDEIMDALNAWAAKQVILPAGCELKVEFTAGRGANGTRATIDFVKVDAPSADLNDTFSPEDEKQVNADVKEVKKIVDTAAKETVPVPEKPVPEKDLKETPEPEKEKGPEEDKAETKETVTAGGTGLSGDSLFNY